MSPTEEAEEEAFAATDRGFRAETWQEEMARFERDPESLRQRKEEGQAVARLLREKGVDLPIVMPNRVFPVGDQIGREARFFEGRQPNMDMGMDVDKEFGS